MKRARLAGRERDSGDRERRSFVSRAVYGVVSVLAVLQPMDEHPPSAWAGAVTLFGTTLAVALLDAYSDSIGEVLSHGRKLAGAEVRAIGRDVRPVLLGAQGPTVVFLLAQAGLWSVGRAIVLSEVLSFLLLFGFGLRIGQRLHEHWLARLASALFLVAIGGVIVAIKAAFH